MNSCWGNTESQTDARLQAASAGIVTSRCQGLIFRGIMNFYLILLRILSAQCASEIRHFVINQVLNINYYFKTDDFNYSIYLASHLFYLFIYFQDNSKFREIWILQKRIIMTSTFSFICDNTLHVTPRRDLSLTLDAKTSSVKWEITVD